MHQSTLRKIDEIASILLDFNPKQDIGLYTGNAGIALFLFYYAQYKNDIEIQSHASNLMDGVYKQIFETQHPLFSHCSGVSGVSWLYDHLCRNRFIQDDPDEETPDVDNFLYQKALNELHRGHYDFLHGAMGIALYFAKRDHWDYLQHLIKILAQIATWDGESAKWRTTLNRQKAETGFNICLSHGSSGIALVLCKILEVMPEDKQVQSLLKGAVTYILKQEIPVEKYGCYFPNISIESQSELYKSRLAWCYGDPGVALAIWRAGLLLKDQEWTDKGFEVLLHLAGRRGLMENRVQDAGFCHGAAGITQFFNRLYRITQRIEFKDAADYWCMETLKMATFEDGLAGYKALHSEEYGGWQPSEYLLEGITGIGLSLLSTVMTDDPAWDECMLLS
jgi:lantibiotic modifying enzyme